MNDKTLQLSLWIIEHCDFNDFLNSDVQSLGASSWQQTLRILTKITQSHGKFLPSERMKLKNFINGLSTTKAFSCDEMWDSFYFRMIKQPRYPTMTRNHVHQFYHACIYDKEETKKAFQRYVEVRTALLSLKTFNLFSIFSFEHQRQIALAFATRCCQKFNLFIMPRESAVITSFAAIWGKTFALLSPSLSSRFQQYGRAA